MSELKKSFADARESVWAELWESLGGVYLNRDGWRQDKLMVEHGHWRVTLDFHAHGGYHSYAGYTRLRAAFENPEGFRFKVTPQGLLERVGKLLGLQDVESGDPEFDRAFVVQSNDEERVKGIIDDELLRSFLRQEPQAFVGLVEPHGDTSERYPDGMDEVLMEVPGKVTDTERLERLYLTFARLLALLCEEGRAYESAAG